MSVLDNTISEVIPQSKINFSNWLCWIFFALLLFVPLIGVVPDVSSDARGYIQATNWRPPIYPLYIWLFHWAGRDQMYWVMWSQTFILLASLIYAMHWLERQLKLSRFMTFLIITGTILVDFRSDDILHHIFTEPLSFALFIVTFCLFIEVMQSYHLKKLVLMLVTCSLLILTRGQFYFMFAPLCLLVLWYFWNKKSIKQFCIVLLLALITMISTVLTERVYHYVRHDAFKGSGFVGRMFAIQPLYLANKSDAQYFKNPIEKNIFLQLITLIEKNHMSEDSAPYPVSWTAHTARPAYYFYQTVFEEIDNFWGDLTYPPQWDKTSEKTEYKIDHVALNIGFTLIQHHLKANIEMYIWKLTYYFDSPWLLFASLLVFIAIIKRALTDRNWQPSTQIIFVSIAFVFILLNAMMIALMQSYTPRYFYYSYFLFFCLFGMVADWLGPSHK